MTGLMLTPHPGQAAVWLSCCMMNWFPLLTHHRPWQGKRHRRGQGAHLKMLPLLLLLLSLAAVLRLETIDEEGGSNCRALAPEKRWRSLRAVLCTRLRLALSGCL